jgi:hypothetical protein
MKAIFKTFLITIFLSHLLISCTNKNQEQVHVFEIKEIQLEANNDYKNPYKEVECWVELSGPDFKKKIYGFWNGEKEFVFRLVATSSGLWSWKSFSNVNDKGLNGKEGSFEAIEWNENEISKNPNRRGFVKSTKNGRALEYADGTPFFMLGDTWWAASTWRFPLKGIVPDDNYVPAEGISFEEAVHYRKKQGYNTIAMIAAYPNWKVDDYPAQYINSDSVGVRQAWEKNGQNTAKDMHDEKGNMPFFQWAKSDIIANFDSINPEYFKSLDKKMEYLSDNGFVVFLETVRRDHGPTWKKYFDWPESFSRYVQYIIARYGAYNIIFSGIHLDWINENFSLTADEFNAALTHHYNNYGSLPYKQPHTILIDGSTYEQFGHVEKAPWLTMHSVGNVPRNHGFYPMIEEIFSLNPPYPAANLEPYYPGWDNPFHNMVAGERPEPNSERDHYFGRAQMYGSVLSGGLAGHIYGTGAYCGNTTGEPKNEGDRPYIWEGLNYVSGSQLPYLAKFLLSEGKAYQNCNPKREFLNPYKTAISQDDGLDGWSFMLLSENNELAFIYFENEAETPFVVSGLIPDKTYSLNWFDPIEGKWLDSTTVVKADSNGRIFIDKFPTDETIPNRDWCLKVKMEN